MVLYRARAASNLQGRIRVVRSQTSIMETRDTASKSHNTNIKTYGSIGKSCESNRKSRDNPKL